jgi:hypothetical protein
MFAFMRRKVWRGFAITFVALPLIVAALSIIAMAWLNPRLTRYIESDWFRADGEVSVHKESLRGTVELGVARRLLDWLPEANEVFPREHDGYLWTTVHLSGTIDAPRQDLSERIMEALKAHPTAALTLFLRQIGAALRHAFGQD